MSLSPSLPMTDSSLSQRPASLVQVFGMEPFHTDGEPLALAFAPDGTLWSIEDPGTLRHWAPADGRQLGWHVLDDLATLWAFAPDCRWVASGSDELSLWDVAEGDVRAVFSPPTWVTSLAFAADGRWLASGHDDGTVRLWDVEGRRMVREFRRGHHRPVSAVAFSPDGKTLASAGEEKTIQLWDVDRGEARLSLLGHTDRIPGLAWHPTLARLYSAGWDTTVRVWDTTTGEPIILLNAHAAQVFALAVNADGRLLACADSANAVFVWDLERNRPVRVWSDQGAEVRCLAFAPDGRTLASGGVDRVLRVRDALHEAPSDTSADPLESRSSVAVSPNGARLYCLPAGAPLRAWEVPSGLPALELKDAGKLRAFALSPDGRRVAASLAVDVPEDRKRSGGVVVPSLYLWDAATGECGALLDGPAPPVTALAFAPDGRLLASAGYTRSDVWLWDADRGEAALLIPGALEGCSVEALAWHPRGDFLAVGGIDYMATGGSDGAIALWDVVARQAVATLGFGTTALAAHPSGSRVAAASLGRTVQVWEVPGGELRAELEGHTDVVTGLAYSPDGRWLASASDDHTVRLWDAATDALAGVTSLDTQAKALCFAPDSASLFTGNANASCYQLSVPKLLAEGV